VLSELLVERHSGVVVLTLNRPECHNALSLSLMQRLATEVESAAMDSSSRVLVIRGAGPSFSAGYDVAGGGTYGARTIHEDARYIRQLGSHWERIWKSPLPVIAQVHGNCLAGGTDLAQHCDLVVVADDAVIGFPAVRSMGVALTQMWLYNVGPQWAKRMLLTGDKMTGRLAAQIGFAFKSVPADRLEQEVMGLAGRLAAVDRELLIGNKAVVNYGLELMGRGALQDMAAIHDAMGHKAAAATHFSEQARELGLREALRERDRPFAPDNPLDIDQ
jgi:enoyl-CoA hydratase